MASAQESQAGQSGQSYDASEASKEKGEPSLTSTLTILQRTQLLQLVARATGLQRRATADAFRADATLPPELRRDLRWSAGGDRASTSVASRDNLDLNPNIDPAKADVAFYDEQRKKLHERETELRKSEVTALRDAALEFLDAWRLEVLQRVGEVVKLKKEAKKQLDDHKEAERVEAEERPNEERKIDVETDKSADGNQVDEQLRLHFPPVPTPLCELDEDKRVLILHSVLLLLLSLKSYTAPSRILLLYLCSSLKLPLHMLDADESKTATSLIEGARELSGKEEADKAAQENKSTHKWKVGLATVAGAAVIGITGGLAAPLVAAGVGSVMGGLGLGATAAAGYLGSLAGSTMLVGGLFGAYGGRMTGQMMDNYAKEVSDFAFVPVHDSDAAQQQAREEAKGRPKLERHQSERRDEAAGKTNPHARRLRVTVGVSGWLTHEDEAALPWRVLGDRTETFALRFDLEALMNLGHAMQAMVKSAAWGYAKKTVISQTLLAELAGAVAWPLGLAKISRVVDNPFTVAKNRADKAGQVMADALINRAQGERPVALIGYSLGARAVYSCLQTLAERRAFGLVESAVLIGSPVPSKTLQWRAMRAVVAGRLVNVYSENDYVLGYLYRASSAQLGVAGMQKVDGVAGIENVDVSATVSGHLRYRYLVGSILEEIGWDDLDVHRLKREKEALEEMDREARDKTLQTRGKEAGLMVAGFEKTGEETADPEGDEVDGEQDEDDAAEKQAQSMERDVRNKTQAGLLERGARYLSLSKGGEGGGAEDGTEQASAVQDNKSDGKDKSQADSKDGGGSYSQYLPNMPHVKVPNMPNMPKVSAPSWSKWAAKDDAAPSNE